MYGKLKPIADIPNVVKSPEAGRFSGIGATMEGFENNPPVHDLLFEMPWRSAPPNLDNWICWYADRRYGRVVAAAQQAWGILAASVYNYPVPANPMDETAIPEAIICARPSLSVEKSSVWGFCKICHDPNQVIKAWGLLLDSADALADRPTYRYDLVDVTRQVLSDYALVSYACMIEKYKARDINSFNKANESFLELIRDMDQLLSTDKAFLLGTWLQQAKAQAADINEVNFYEWNARTMITVWGDRGGAISLHEYAQRQWAGLLTDFYLPRWVRFIDKLKVSIAKNIPFDQAKFDKEIIEFEFDWTRQHKTYPITPIGDTVAVSKKMWNKYGKRSEK